MYSIGPRPHRGSGMQYLDEELIAPVAWAHTTALRGAGILPESFEGLDIARPGDTVRDLDGEPLFRRLRLESDEVPLAFIDVVVHPALGHPFLAVTEGRWSGHDALADAARKARELGAVFDDVRLVAYSYPKLAVQFLHGGDEVLMLELYTHAEIPRQRGSSERPGNFERWSLLEHLAERRQENQERFEQHVSEFR